MHNVYSVNIILRYYSFSDIVYMQRYFCLAKCAYFVYNTSIINANSNYKFCRSGDIEKHVVEPAAKNKFLSELEEIDAAQLEQVSCGYLHYGTGLSFGCYTKNA